jgi:hypothetical protein
MKEFLLILFLGKSVILTPSPVTLENIVTLEPDEPISAVTTGASLEIDVSNILIKPKEEGIPEFTERVEKLFPPYTISASLMQADGKEVVLIYTGGHSYNHESTRLSLYSEDGVPTDQEFAKVVIITKAKIEGVTVHWKNYKH